MDPWLWMWLCVAVLVLLVIRLCLGSDCLALHTASKPVHSVLCLHLTVAETPKVIQRVHETDGKDFKINDYAVVPHMHSNLNVNQNTVTNRQKGNNMLLGLTESTPSVLNLWECISISNPVPRELLPCFFLQLTLFSISPYWLGWVSPVFDWLNTADQVDQ